MGLTDTQLLDWVLNRGWVCRVKRKRPRPFQNDTFLRVLNSRADVERAMADQGKFKYRRPRK
jgi:hypothetical protein